MSKRALSFAALFLPVLGADRLTKALVVARLHAGETVHILGNVCTFTLLYNRNGIFGMPVGSRPLYLVLSTAVLLIMIIYYFRLAPSSRIERTALAVLCGGAAGNLADRVPVSDPASGVVDFIRIGVGGVYWPAFNIADIAITVGLSVLAWRLLARSHADPHVYRRHS